MIPPNLDVLCVVTAAQRRGAELFALALGRDLEDRGHRTRTVALERHDDNVPGIEVLGPRRTAPRTLGALHRAVAECDVVISFGGSTVLPVIAAALATDTAAIYRNIGDPTAWATTRTKTLRLGAAFRRFDAVVALYGQARRELIVRYALDPGRVPVVNNCIDVSLFAPDRQPDRPDACARLGWDPDRRRVVTIGALTTEKRPDLACEIAEGLPEDVELVLVGNGPERDSVLERATAIRPNGRIRLMPATDDVAAVYRAADVVLVTSRTEGMPAVMIEAALCERPRVAPRCGGISEMVTDGIDGRLVDVDAPVETWVDAVLESFDHPEWGRTAAHNAIERWDIATAGAAFAEIVQAVVVDRANRGQGTPGAASLRAVTAALTTTTGS